MNNTDELLLNPQTKKSLEIFFNSPGHALLIVGPSGSGKSIVAKTLAAKLLKSPLEKYPYYFHLYREDGKQEISIDSVRATISKLQLKTPGSSKIRKIIFIEEANFLSLPAQSAILKILEEPSEDSVFLLTAASTESLLPTIVSRTSKIAIKPIGLEDAKRYWKQKHEILEIEKAWRLSGGSTGLLFSLLSEDRSHPLFKAVDDVKLFLKTDKYNRLLLLDKSYSNKEKMGLFIEALLRVLQNLHHAAISKNLLNQSYKILISRKIALSSQEALNKNVSLRLINLRLVDNLQV